MDFEIKSRLQNYKTYKKILRKIVYSYYAKEVLDICRKINKSRCIGCQYNHLSQHYHDCLSTSTYHIFLYHFEEAVKKVNYESIPEIFYNCLKSTGIPLLFVEKFSNSFDWNWWKQNGDLRDRFVDKIRKTAHTISVVDF